MGAVDPLVGREPELEQLMGQMSKALAGEGGLVLVSGEAGSGKTTICQEFGRMAIQSGCAVMVGRCVPGPLSPFLPFMEAFHEMRPNPFQIDGGKDIGDRDRLLLAIMESVERSSNMRPMVIWLEDLHWADSASISLVHLLARNIRSWKVILLCTYRPEEVHALPSGEAHPLMESLRVLRREGICLEIPLERLRAVDIRKLVPLRLGGEAEENIIDTVTEESEGNPLFAVEYLNLLLCSGAIASTDGLWRLRHEGAVGVPQTIREVVRARIEQVPRRGRRLMEVASVIGEWFDPWLVAKVAEERLSDVLEQLEPLERENRLIMESDRRYRFGHEKIRTVVYEDLSSARRRDLHRRTIVGLEDLLPNEELLGDLALHARLADDNDRCIKYSLQAGKYCLHRGAMMEAKMHLQQVLALSDDDPRRLSERLEALEGLGDMHNNLANPREWYSYYEGFLALNRDRAARARVLTKAAECFDQMGLDDIKRGGQMLDEAEALCEGDHRVLAEVEFRRSEMFSNSGQRSESLIHVAKAKEHYRAIGDDYGVIMSMRMEALALRQGYRWTEAEELWRTIVHMSRESRVPELIISSLGNHAMLMARMGRTEEAKAYANEVAGLADTLGQTWSWRLILQSRAMALELEGDLQSAVEDLRKSLVSARALKMAYHNALMAVDLGICEVQMGCVDEAQSHYDECARVLEPQETWFKMSVSNNLTILRAELLAARGLWEMSDEVYGEAIDYYRRMETPYEELNCEARHGLQLAHRGLHERALTRFQEALSASKALGCEPRVLSLVRRTGPSSGKYLEGLNRR